LGSIWGQIDKHLGLDADRRALLLARTGDKYLFDPPKPLAK
jgi:hypothetical protein